MTFTGALGWALVHFLWQGAAAAVALGVLLAATRKNAARLRYGLGLATLGVMLVLPIATVIRLRGTLDVDATPPVLQRSVTTLPVSNAAPAAKLEGVAPATAPAAAPAVPLAWRARMTLEALLPWVVAAWLAGVLLLSLRLAAGWAGARRLRISGTKAAPAACLEMLERLAARLRVRRTVELFESVMVQVPAVLGWLRPVILVPTSALTGLTPQQLEVLIAHELAHVRRHDYLVNLAQSVIETVLFYHPAVWWVSRQVREERENCCDDLAVAVCGDPGFYATALLGMERLRAGAGAPEPALAASGGSLVSRIRRLVAPGTVRTEIFPRWAAGVVAVAGVTLALVMGGASPAGAVAELVAEPVAESLEQSVSESHTGSQFASDSGRTAPDTVLRYADATRPLAERWEWARAQARQLGRRMYWVGYRVRQPAWLEHSVFIDRWTEVRGHDITMSGRMFGDFQGFMFRGARLAPLVGDSEPDAIALLFGFAVDASGRPTLARVHVSSYYLPVDFGGRTLAWLGAADDAESIALVQGLYAAAPSVETREDLVGAVGIHGSSDAVVPLLVGWLTGRESTGVREQAAEWLGFHPQPAAVRALARAARTDAAGDVRREAAEALGDNRLPAATDSLIAIARTLTDADARREAVEGLGEKDEPRAQAALVAIAQDDRSQDVQREAVETLGDLPDRRGLADVLRFARSHPRVDVRREAVETYGEHASPAQALEALRSIAKDDANPDVQREAVETLGELEDGAGLVAVADLARTHPSGDVRREAVETLGEHSPTAETVRTLAGIARDDRNSDVQREAVETLGQMEGGMGLAQVIDLARTHPTPDVRREAVETIGESAPAEQAFDLLLQIARRDADADVQREAVEALGQIEDPRAFAALRDLARNHPSSDVRREAIETLGETADADSVADLLEGLARSGNDPDAQREAVETLGELRGARALAGVARIARANLNEDVRREAIETYGEYAEPDAAVALFKELLASDAPTDLLEQVVEALGELHDGAGIPTLIDVARAHPNREVRSKALQDLADSDDPRAVEVFQRALLRRP